MRADGVERYLASQHIQVWSADFPADDWTKITPAEVYERALAHIEAYHKGILLLHDIQPRTVEALPYLLRELKRRGYRIVHVVPATPELPRTVTVASDWVLHNHKIWPLTPVYAEVEPELAAPSPASFGVANAFDTQSVVHAPTGRQRAARGQIPMPPVGIWPPDVEPPPMSSASLRTPPATSHGMLAAPALPPVSITSNAPFDLVPETSGHAIDIRRALPMELSRIDRPTGAVASSPLRRLLYGEMPRGAFP